MKSVFAIFLLFFAASTTVVAQENSEVGEYLGAKKAIHPPWFKTSFLDLEEDIAEAAEEGRRLVLYFWQPGCPYCAELMHNNFAQRDISEFMQENFDLVAMNMWGDRQVVQVGGKVFSEKNLADALHVKYTPTLMFFNENREVALRLDGYVPPERFRLAMNYASGDGEETESFSAFVAKNVTIPAHGSLLPEDFFVDAPFDLAKLSVGSSKPLAIYFEQKQCSACDNLHYKVLADESTRALARQFNAVQLDIWSDTEVIRPDGIRTTAREWAVKLDLSYAPSIVLFDTGGEEVMRIDAFLKTFHTQSVFDYVLSKGYQEEPNFQRYISARAERLREQGIDVDIWSY